MKIVGVTGSVACGKSTVSGMLAKFGARLLSSDEIVHELSKKGTAEYSRIAGKFGSVILNQAGEIDRKKLKAIALKRRSNLLYLERVYHPGVKRAIRKKIGGLSKKKGLLIIEVPLLFESGLNKIMDRVIVVIAPDKLRRRFAHRKGMSYAELGKFTRAQWSDEKKRKGADYIIRNNGDLKKLAFNAKRIYKRAINDGTI